MRYVTITRKWWKKAEVYQFFAREYKCCDFSKESAIAQYVYESRGLAEGTLVGYCGLTVRPDGTYNGYTVGKHWLDFQVTNWINDIMDGLLFVEELYEDPELKELHWWLDNVVKKPTQEKEINAWWVSCWRKRFKQQVG